MNAKKVVKRSGKAKTDSRKRKAIVGAGPAGCNYSVTWTLLANTKGYVPVWVPNKLYD